MKIQRFNEQINDIKFKKFTKVYSNVNNTNKQILYRNIEKLNKFDIKYDIYYCLMKGNFLYIAVNAYLNFPTEGFPLSQMNVIPDDNLISSEELERYKDSLINSGIWIDIKKEDIYELIDITENSNKFNL
jgi:hypothetical protein